MLRAVVNATNKCPDRSTICCTGNGTDTESKGTSSTTDCSTGQHAHGPRNGGYLTLSLRRYLATITEDG